MRKLTYFCLAFVFAVMLALPTAAQKGRGATRSNEDNKLRGKERAEQVQLEDKGTVAPGVEKAETKDKKNNGKHKHKGWSKKAEHNAKGHNK